MAPKKLASEDKPCLWTGGLQPNTWIPAAFGRFYGMLTCAVGSVPLKRRIRISRSRIGSEDMANRMESMLRDLGYLYIAIVP